MPETTFEGWMREMEGQIESTRESETLTADDFTVSINATSDEFDGGRDVVPLQPHERVNR